MTTCKDQTINYRELCLWRLFIGTTKCTTYQIFSQFLIITFIFNYIYE